MIILMRTNNEPISIISKLCCIDWILVSSACMNTLYWFLNFVAHITQSGLCFISTSLTFSKQFILPMRLYQPTVQRVPSSFLWAKRPGPEVDPSTPCSAEVQNKWNYIYSSPACLHGVERDNYIFTFKILFSLYHETQNNGVGEGLVEIRLTVKKYSLYSHNFC